MDFDCFVRNKTSAMSQLLTKKKDRFAAHSQRFLANLKGSANAHFRSLSRISNWLNYPKLERSPRGGFVAI
jgi:hypothetical protein